MTDWGTLTHAFGSAEDIPELLADLRADRDGYAWDALWERACGDGQVYSASYALLPELAALVRDWPIEDSLTAVAMAGEIVASAPRPPVPPDAGPLAEHSAAIAELAGRADEALRLLAAWGDDADGYALILAAKLALDGDLRWSDLIDVLMDQGADAKCPACGTLNFLVFGDDGFFTTLVPGRRSDAAAVPLEPAHSSSLDGTFAGELHARIVADGYRDLAERLAYVLGDWRCAAPSCGRSFRVSDTLLQPRR